MEDDTPHEYDDIHGYEDDEQIEDGSSTQTNLYTYFPLDRIVSDRRVSSEEASQSEEGEEEETQSEQTISSIKYELRSAELRIQTMIKELDDRQGSHSLKSESTVAENKDSIEGSSIDSADSLAGITMAQLDIPIGVFGHGLSRPAEEDCKPKKLLCML